MNDESLQCRRALSHSTIAQKYLNLHALSIFALRAEEGFDNFNPSLYGKDSATLKGLRHWPMPTIHIRSGFHHLTPSAKASSSSYNIFLGSPDSKHQPTSWSFVELAEHGENNWVMETSCSSWKHSQVNRGHAAGLHSTHLVTQCC